MPYQRSLPLERWLGDRRANITVLEKAHATLGEVSGPGRPLEVGRPVAHAYILRVVAEFQGFVRELHDLAAARLVALAKADVAFSALLVEAATLGRAIDSGNAGVTSLERDFRRLGLRGLQGRLSARWVGTTNTRGDRAFYQELIELRNALAHGNPGQLAALRARGVRDTLSWARDRLPALDRTARSLDHVVWDHLSRTFGAEPW